MNEKERKALIAQRKGEKLPENYRDYWTDDAANTLERMYLGDGYGISEIALFFGRNELSIYQQLLKRGFIGPPIPGEEQGGPVLPRCRCLRCKVLECPHHGKTYEETCEEADAIV